MKDNFSAQAKLYASFRPHYPAALYTFLFSQLKNFDHAADLATGNGQVAVQLAMKFKKVYATDISSKQLSEAPQLSNIIYKTEAAESTSFDNNYFDLITVAQAIHWFDFEKFYTEVKRILKKDGIIAVIGYGLLRFNTSAELNDWLDHYYYKIIYSYWDKERKYVDELYKTIPFPFTEIQSPSLQIEYEWTKDQFIGYLNTWSAVQHFIKTNNEHPLSESLLQQLDKLWPEDVLYKISFPLLLRVGHE